MRAYFRRHRAAVLIISTAFIAVLLYLPTFSLPLLFDDLLHLRLSMELDLLTVWLPTTKFAFYRPLVFLPFPLLRSLFGYVPRDLLNGVNIVQHAVNVALLAALTWRLWRRPSRTIAAGLLLATYPFAYQTVVMFGNNVYLTIGTLQLTGLHLYLTAVRRPHTTAAGRARLLLYLITILGLFAHESMVLFISLLLLLHWADRGIDWQLWRWPWRRPRQLLQRAPYLPVALLTALYLLVYPFIPTGTAPTPAAITDQLWPKLLFLVQSTTYPTAWLAHQLPNLSANVIVGGSLLLLLLLTAWAARRRENRLPLLFAWGWWFGASLLYAVTLSTDYLLHSARLLYHGGIGTALIWTIVLDSFWQRSTLSRLAWSSAVLAIALSSTLFVVDRLRAYERIDGPVELAAEILENRPAAEGVLFVNLPSWTSPARNTYAAGVEYVTLMGGHVSAEDLIAFNLYQRHPVTAVEVADLLANPGFAYDTHVEKRLPLPVDWAPEGSHVIINHYTTEGITAEYAGELHPEPAPGPAQAAFGPYELLAAAAELCAGTADVTLHWRVTGPDLPPTISVFSQLISDGGQLVGQLDQPPLQLRPDLLTGMQAWSMVEYRQIAAEQTPAALLVGVYDYVTGERFTGVDRHNAPLVDDAFAIPVTACAPNGE